MAIFSIATTVILYTVFVFFLGIYGYNNPDPDACYFIEGLETTELTRADAISKAASLGVPVKVGYPVNMAHLYRAWFIWGFWDKLYQLVIVAVFVPLAILMREKMVVPLRIVFSGLQSLACCSTMIWFFMGLFWRFS